MLRAFPVLDDADAGLGATLDVLRLRERITRRAALRRLAGAGALLAPPGAWAATCSVIPATTEGPFPGDGTNGPNALAQSGIVRSDIRANFGPSGTAVSAGIPMLLTLQLVDTSRNCAGLAGYAVYAWHCDAVGRYSMYSNGVARENFLRGVQAADGAGQVTFATIFPGCYGGRWPHVHFEIYRSIDEASTGRNAIRTTQLALPAAASQAVYSGAKDVYAGSDANLARMSLASDFVFPDGARLQMATVTGSNAEGYRATLDIGVAAS